MLATTPIAYPPTTAKSAWDRISAVELGLIGFLPFAGLFVSPLVPGQLQDWPALRTEMFFQGLSAIFPVVPGDGPLAFLLRPMFGTGHTLAHIIYELCAALFLTLVALPAIIPFQRWPRLGIILAFLFATTLLREAGFWIAGGLFLLPRPRASSQSIGAFFPGIVLGVFGLLRINFLLWGAVALVAQIIVSKKFTRDTRACLAGWMSMTLVGWNAMPGGMGGIASFLSDGWSAFAIVPGWQLVAGLFLIALTVWLALRGSELSAVIVTTAAFLVGSIPLEPDTFRQAGLNLRTTLEGHVQAWSVAIHPERFQKRILSPAWKQLAAVYPLPQIKEQVGTAVVDVVGPNQLVALANGLRHLPGSRAKIAKAVITPVAYASIPGSPANSRQRLFVENGFSLFTSARPGFAGLSPAALWKIAPYDNLPVVVESPALPRPDYDQDRRIAAFALPMHLVYGPIPYATEQIVGHYYAEGDASRVLIFHQNVDGTRKLLLERGLNPKLKEEERGVQSFNLEMPANSSGWIEINAKSADDNSSSTVRLVDVEFRRDLNRMISTTLVPRALHDSGGFMSMPLFVFSGAEAVPIRTENAQPVLTAHMPALLAFAKPREVTRLTGTYGFMPGAYAHADAGTNGAVFNVSWYSGNDGVRQIFSRTLKPKQDAEDRGPQKFDLDVSDLPDGIIQIGISPAVPRDISWGWTYLGEIDLRTAHETRPQSERIAEINLAYETGFRPSPGLIKTNEQKPRVIQAGDASLLRVHAPGEVVIGVSAGHVGATGRFGFADEAWKTKRQTDGADFVVLWRDHHGDVELFRRRLLPDTQPADRGAFTFSVDLTGRGNGLLVLRTEPGAAGNNYWDWTGWSDVTVR